MGKHEEVKLYMLMKGEELCSTYVMSALSSLFILFPVLARFVLLTALRLYYSVRSLHLQ